MDYKDIKRDGRDDLQSFQRENSRIKWHIDANPFLLQSNMSYIFNCRLIKFQGHQQDQWCPPQVSSNVDDFAKFSQGKLVNIMSTDNQSTKLFDSYFL